jgi:hypothetical protein
MAYNPPVHDDLSGMNDALPARSKSLEAAGTPALR